MPCISQKKERGTSKEENTEHYSLGCREARSDKVSIFNIGLGLASYPHKHAGRVSGGGPSG